MVLSATVYAGLLIAALGAVAVLRPLPIPGTRTRRQGAILALAGAVITVTAMALPAPETVIDVPRSHLDQLVPRYQFNEVHSTRVHAPPAVVYRAIQEVTAGEIRLFRTLTWIRRAGRSGPEGILNAPGHMPLLDVATRSGFIELAREPDREVVIGTVVILPPFVDRPTTADDFQALVQPGVARALMNFRVEPDPRGGSILSTETRVYATDSAARRRFARYWRAILPGSALIRRTWLAAIRRRSEALDTRPAMVALDDRLIHAEPPDALDPAVPASLERKP